MKGHTLFMTAHTTPTQLIINYNYRFLLMRGFVERDSKNKPHATACLNQLLCMEWQKHSTYLIMAAASFDNIKSLLLRL